MNAGRLACVVDDDDPTDPYRELERRYSEDEPGAVWQTVVSRKSPSGDGYVVVSDHKLPGSESIRGGYRRPTGVADAVSYAAAELFSTWGVAVAEVWQEILEDGFPEISHWQPVAIATAEGIRDFRERRLGGGRIYCADSELLAIAVAEPVATSNPPYLRLRLRPVSS